MSSTDETIENWPRSLREYPVTFNAGNKKDPDSPTFMDALNGKYGEEYRDAMGVEMQALQRATMWSLFPRNQVPRGDNILPLTWVFKFEHYPDGRPWNSRQDCVCKATSKWKALHGQVCPSG